MTQTSDETNSGVKTKNNKQHKQTSALAEESTQATEQVALLTQEEKQQVKSDKSQQVDLLNVAPEKSSEADNESRRRLDKTAQVQTAAEPQESTKQLEAAQMQATESATNQCKDELKQNDMLEPNEHLQREKLPEHKLPTAEQRVENDLVADHMQDESMLSEATNERLLETHAMQKIQQQRQMQYEQNQIAVRQQKLNEEFTNAIETSENLAREKQKQAEHHLWHVQGKQTLPTIVEVNLAIASANESSLEQREQKILVERMQTYDLREQEKSTEYKKTKADELNMQDLEIAKNFSNNFDKPQVSQDLMYQNINDEQSQVQELPTAEKFCLKLTMKKTVKTAVQIPRLPIAENEHEKLIVENKIKNETQHIDSSVQVEQQQQTLQLFTKDNIESQGLQDQAVEAVVTLEKATKQADEENGFHQVKDEIDAQIKVLPAQNSVKKIVEQQSLQANQRSAEQSKVQNITIESNKDLKVSSELPQLNVNSCDYQKNNFELNRHSSSTVEKESSQELFLDSKILKTTRESEMQQSKKTTDLVENTTLEPQKSFINLENNNTKEDVLLNVSNIPLTKNKSNLYLIKSHSFIDKSNTRRPQRRSSAGNEIYNAAAAESDHTNDKASTKNTKENTNSIKKKSKHQTESKNLQKLKSRNDALDDDLSTLLRKPSVILECDDEANTIVNTNIRPHSMPASSMLSCLASAEAATTKSSNRRSSKRESFLRQSLQSIRRSFSSHKKFNGHSSKNNPCSSSNASTCSNSSHTSNTSNSSSTSSSSSSSFAIVEDVNVSHSGNNAENSHKCPRIMVNGVATNTIETDGDDDNGVGKDLKETDNATCDTCTGCHSAKCKRSTSSVSTLANATSDTSMAPLQCHDEAHSVTCLNLFERDNILQQQPQQKQHQTQAQKRQQYTQQLSTPGSVQSDRSSTALSTTSSRGLSYQNLSSESSSLKTSSASLVPLSNVPILRPISLQSGSNTAKHEQTSSAAASTAAATAANNTNTGAVLSDKEKKRKEVSSSRVKKFHRHFSQVSKDEKLINYFSCALVSDILLQGHLYITDHHFAFYSNVFGYVTKVVIPTSSVTKISKEKTAKIIPNAVGVATADERHVFGSFISRESAFRLMCSVCPLPLPSTEVLTKAPTDIEISEEYSIEDDSSCSISGNESSSQILKVVLADENGQVLKRRTVVTSSADSDKLRHIDIPANAKANITSAQQDSKSPAKTLDIAPSAGDNVPIIVAGSISTSTSSTSSIAPSTSSTPITVMAMSKPAAQKVTGNLRSLFEKTLQRLKFPQELHVVYLGVVLAVVLALFSVFLLYRILDIEAKTNFQRASADFHWRSGNDDDIFAEALRWQKELQTKSTEEAQNILSSNLEQIAKVRRSLETLSMLIHDRSSGYANVVTNTDESTAN